MSSPPERPPERRPSRLFGPRDSESSRAARAGTSSRLPTAAGLPAAGEAAALLDGRHGSAGRGDRGPVRAERLDRLDDPGQARPGDHRLLGHRRRRRSAASSTKNNILSVSYEGDQIEGEFRKPITFPPDSKSTAQFFVDPPAAPAGRPRPVSEPARPRTCGWPRSRRRTAAASWPTRCCRFGPTLLFLGLLFFVFRRSPMGGGGGPRAASAARGPSATPRPRHG